MALFEATFRSGALNKDTNFNVILPENCYEEDITVLYLLHGMYGNHSLWIRKSCIEQYAHERKIAVIMPDGENAYYTDIKYGKNIILIFPRSL